MATYRRVTRVTSRELWEANARWWIDGFTDGADPEYAEQILPLAAAELAGARARARRRVRRRPDHPPGRGARRRRPRRRRRPDVEPDLRRRRARRRVGRGARRWPTRLPFADASFDAVVACLVFEHIDEVDEAIAEVARVLAPGGRFCFFLNHPLLQTPDSGWIDDQVIDPPEQYWRIGPYLAGGRDDRGGGAGRPHPLRPPPAVAVRQRARRARAADRADDRAGAAAAGSSPSRRSTPPPPPFPGCCTSDLANSAG